LHFEKYTPIPLEEKKHFIIDFDSTFTKVEALDILAEIALEGNSEKEAVINRVKEVTDLGMGGELSFRDSLEERISIIKAHKNHIPLLVNSLKKNISNSFKRNKEFIKNNSDQFYILSNGFKEFIIPVVIEYGIEAKNVYANEFVFDAEGYIISFNKNNVLSSNKGKPKQIEMLKLKGEVHVLGDGFTDYEIKQAGFAKTFYAFTENIKREKVINHADFEVPNLDEVFYQNNMERALSYPKSRIKVLLLENVHENAISKLRSEGYQINVYNAGMSEGDLCKAIKDVSILGIRSKTQVTEKVLSHAKRLLAIGAFCIGTNQIEIKSAQKRGIAVFNAPYSNTRSVVELVVAEIIILMRNLFDKIAKMHQGEWNKSAHNSFEVRGKTLGIIGYGNIGSQLSIVAESLGMKVIYFDLIEKLGLGNVSPCESLEELMAQSDVISVHVDGRKENNNLIGKLQFDLMKPGVIFLNLSRGNVVNNKDLKNAIQSGQVGGAGVDVFPKEPMSNEQEFLSELRGLPNTILTPHIGGSTLEAQKNIANFVPSRIIDYINTGSTSNTVGFPNITLPILHDAHRFIHIHTNAAGVMAKINKILAHNKLNVVGQYLKTNENIGYVITDIDKKYDKEVIKELKGINETIRFRVLY
tara:strand:- start:2289 stop:4211 length:1923 start_codon:yes stop_codon:yes gene_type:complete